MQAALACMQGLALGDQDKHEKELEIASKLLDQVKGYYGFDNIQTRAKAREPVTHSDLEKALQCSSHMALKHAEAYGTLALQQVEALQEKAATAGALAVLKTQIKGLQAEMKSITDHVENNEGSIRTNEEDMKKVKTDITEIKNMLEDTERRIANLDTNIQLDQE